jgi:predicted Zn-dependent peptidase
MQVTHVLETALLGDAHPLLRLPEPSCERLAKATLADVWRVHRQLCDPRLATLIVVGQMASEALRRDLDDGRCSVAALSTGSLLPRRSLPAPAETPADIRLVEAGGSGQVLLVGACLLPAFDAAGEWVLEALSHLLGGSQRSRLNRRLREELRWTYGVRSAMVDAGRSGAPRLLRIETSVDPARAAASLLEVHGILAALAGPGAPTPEEVEDFRHSASQRLPSFAREPREVVWALDFQRRRGLRGLHWTERVELLERLSVQEVRAAARDLLRPERFRWALAGDAAGLATQIKQHGLRAEIHSMVEQPA